MTATTITIGWTRSDMSKGYSSFDGYRPGASQHTETITVDVPDTMDQCLVAEAAFRATNAPYLKAEDHIGIAILAALHATGYRGQGAHWSLSVGDTVTTRHIVTGEPETLACESLGWVIVKP